MILALHTLDARTFNGINQEKSEISSDWTGNAYCALKIDWDYTNDTVDLSMPGYIKSTLHKYQHPAHAHAEHAPHKWNPPVYGAKTQYIEELEDSPSLSQKDVNCIQQLGGKFLHYARAVEPTFIMRVNVLASEQTRTTSDTTEKIIKMLNYCTTHPEATLCCHASDMILNIHCDASYLSEREAKSRAGGFFYMGSKTDKTNRLANGEILIISTVLKHITSSAAGAEIGAEFLNAKEGTVLCTTLEAL
jgi:hypothetical protein